MTIGCSLQNAGANRVAMLSIIKINDVSIFSSLSWIYNKKRVRRRVGSKNNSVVDGSPRLSTK
jgi:hypothetical protein